MTTALVWLVAIAVIGLAALPLTLAFLPRFANRGDGVATTLGIVLLPWLNRLLGVSLGAASRRCARDPTHRAPVRGRVQSMRVRTAMPRAQGPWRGA
jgi:hypothetical protein